MTRAWCVGDLVRVDVERAKALVGYDGPALGLVTTVWKNNLEVDRLPSGNVGWADCERILPHIVLAAHGFELTPKDQTTGTSADVAPGTAHVSVDLDVEFCCGVPAGGTRPAGTHWQPTAEEALRHAGVEPQAAVVVLWERAEALRLERRGQKAPASTAAWHLYEEISEAIEHLDAERQKLLAR